MLFFPADLEGTKPIQNHNSSSEWIILAAMHCQSVSKGEEAHN